MVAITVCLEWSPLNPLYLSSLFMFTSDRFFMKDFIALAVKVLHYILPLFHC